MRRGWLGLAGLLVLASIPRESGAQLAQASTGFAFARVLENPASVIATPGANGLDVTIGATATDLLDLPDDQYLLDFAYEATVAGSGNVDWGGGAGSLTLDTSATPELSPPVDPLGQPMFSQSSEAGGQLYLRFTELGTLTSAILPAGTPVQVVLNARVDSMAVVSGSLDPPNDTRAGAGFEARLTDSLSGMAELFLSGNEIETMSLTSAVGRTLEIQGVFRATAEAFAGQSLCCPGYTPEATAAVEGAGALWLTLPTGVGFDAASDHDYTVPVPEPSPFALALGAALAIVGLRAAGASRPRGGANEATARREISALATHWFA